MFLPNLPWIFGVGRRTDHKTAKPTMGAGTGLTVSESTFRNYGTHAIARQGGMGPQTPQSRARDIINGPWGANTKTHSDTVLQIILMVFPWVPRITINMI
jgi:hypothetical protein